MRSTIEAALLVGFAFTLIYILSFLRGGRHRSGAGLALLVVLVVALLEIGFGFVFYSGLIQEYPHLLRINTPFVFLLAPALCVLVEHRFAKNKLTKWHLLHLLPFVACVIYLLPLYLSGAEEKLAYMSKLISGTNPDSYLVGGIRRAQQGSYLVYFLLIFFRNRNILRHKENHFVILAVSGFALLWIVGLFRYFFWFHLFGGLVEILTLTAVLVYLVYDGLSFDIKPRAKYKTSGLSAELMNRYARQIREGLEQGKTFSKTDLTLMSFADSISIPAHHISQVLSQEMKTSFKELLNRYRITEAKNLLHSRDHQHLKIEAVARMAGFSSVSAFNSAFRKSTGTSPTGYQRNPELAASR